MTGVRVRLTFPELLIREPVLALLAREHDVLPNIRRASVDDHEGWIICEIDGEARAVDAAIAWLTERGVTVDYLGDVVES